MQRIAESWDDLLRLAGSLKLGRVSATGIMRTLQVGDRSTRIAQALAEFGRIEKTLHILNYIDDENFRRSILTQLNRGEGRHSLARMIFHGKRGELRQRYREGQEDQLGALGLVLNIIVLWNTIYIDAILAQLRLEGLQLKTKMSLGCHLLFTSISICWGAIHSQCRNQLLKEICDRYVTRKKRRLILNGVFCSIAP